MGCKKETSKLVNMLFIVCCRLAPARQKSKKQWCDSGECYHPALLGHFVFTISVIRADDLLSHLVLLLLYRWQHLSPEPFSFSGGLQM